MPLDRGLIIMTSQCILVIALSERTIEISLRTFSINECFPETV